MANPSCCGMRERRTIEDLSHGLYRRPSLIHLASRKEQHQVNQHHYTAVHWNYSINSYLSRTSLNLEPLSRWQTLP